PPPSHIYTLSLHDALPISCCESFQLSFDIITVPLTSFNPKRGSGSGFGTPNPACDGPRARTIRLTEPLAPLTMKPPIMTLAPVRSEEHTSELQSRGHLVCR